MTEILILWLVAAVMGGLTLLVAFLGERWKARHPHPLAGMTWYAWHEQHQNEYVRL